MSHVISEYSERLSASAGQRANSICACVAVTTLGLKSSKFFYMQIHLIFTLKNSSNRTKAIRQNKIHFGRDTGLKCLFPNM